MRYGREIAFGLTVLVLGAALWLWLTSGSAGTDAASPAGEPDPRTARADPDAGSPDAPERAPTAPATAGAAPAGGEAEVAGADEPEPPARPTPPFRSIEVPAERIPPSTRPFASPEEASDFVEGRVVALLEAVAPELDFEHMERECTPDGTVCTFYGEWPGDDFLKRWLKAIAEDRTGLEMLDGVRFSTFKPIEENGERRLMLRAHAP